MFLNDTAQDGTNEPVSNITVKKIENTAWQGSGSSCYLLGFLTGFPNNLITTLKNFH